MTSTQHGAQIGGASNPCKTLYKLLMEVRKYEKVETTGKGWEEKIYMEIVKRRDQVMRKGKEEKKKPVYGYAGERVL